MRSSKQSVETAPERGVVVHRVLTKPPGRRHLRGIKAGREDGGRIGEIYEAKGKNISRALIVVLICSNDSSTIFYSLGVEFFF